MNKLAEYLTWRAVPDIVVKVFNTYRDEIMEKGAESPILKNLAVYGQLRPGKMFGSIPNAPGPLSSMLVGGLAGTGIGYGLGTLGEQILPDSWQRNRLRRTMAILGGALGASPGILAAGSNLSTGKSFNDTTNFQAGFTAKPKPRILPEKPFGPEQLQFLQDMERSAEVKEAYEKAALVDGTGIFGTPIDVDEFNQVIWSDPRVSGPIPPPLRAAASGLVTSAANLPGRTSTRFVSPLDVGRITAGMGTGYASGMLVGKTLGLLMGMPDQTQERLKNTGMWAGIIANAIPIAFGG